MQQFVACKHLKTCTNFSFVFNILNALVCCSFSFDRPGVMILIQFLNDMKNLGLYSIVAFTLCNE